jgi:hypothetical protein
MIWPPCDWIISACALLTVLELSRSRQVSRDPTVLTGRSSGSSGLPRCSPSGIIAAKLLRDAGERAEDDEAAAALPEEAGVPRVSAITQVLWRVAAETGERHDRRGHEQHPPGGAGRRRSSLRSAGKAP